MSEASDSPTLAILLDETKDSAHRLECLLPLVYDQLRAVAQRALAAERPEHTLQATALVHEAYLKLVGEREIPWASRAHFYVAAAEAMRRILIDHARARGRVKRGGGGGGRARLTLSDVTDLASKPDEIVRFDEAFRRLEEEAAGARSCRSRFESEAGCRPARGQD